MPRFNPQYPVNLNPSQFVALCSVLSLRVCFFFEVFYFNCFILLLFFGNKIAEIIHQPSSPFSDKGTEGTGLVNSVVICTS